MCWLVFWGARHARIGARAMGWVVNAGREPGVREYAKANSGCPRGRHGWRVRTRLREGVGNRQRHRTRGRKHEPGNLLIEQLDFLHQLKRLILLLRLPALLNDCADLARMTSIERLLHSLRERRMPRIVHDHRGPCHRLQHRPMTADCQKQRPDQQPSADAEKCLGHSCLLCIPKNFVKLSAPTKFSQPSNHRLPQNLAPAMRLARSTDYKSMVRPNVTLSSCK
jgi:hypothetical protein